jgi:hypothetical protein
MSFKTSISKDETATEPVFVREGDEVAFVIPVQGVVTAIASPTMAFFQEGQQTDKVATYWTGSMSISGVDTVVTKTTTSLKAGNWVMSIGGTVDGQVMNIVTIPFIVKRKSEL